MNKQTLSRMVSVEREIASEKGPFVLFALFLRDDAPDVWDLVASATWLDRDKQAGLAYLIKKVRSHLAAGEFLMLSRFVVLEQENPILRAVHRGVQTEHPMTEVVNCTFDGLHLRHAYIFTSKPQTKKEKRKRAAV